MRMRIKDPVKEAKSSTTETLIFVNHFARQTKESMSRQKVSLKENSMCYVDVQIADGATISIER